MKKLVLILAMTILPLTAFAQDGFYLSGMLGMTQLSIDGASENPDAELSYGVRAGLLFNDHVSAGVFVKRYSTDLGAGVEFGATNVMGEVTYYFAEADENSFYLGGLLGITQWTLETPLGDADESDTAFGVSAGYQFAVAPNFSIAPQITYIHTNADNTVSDITGMVNLTFWL